MYQDLDKQILSFLRRIHDEDYLEHLDDIIFEGFEYFGPCNYPNFESFLDAIIEGSVMTFILSYIYFRPGEYEKADGLIKYVTNHTLKHFRKKIKNYYDDVIDDMKYDGEECPKVSDNINENVVTKSDIESSIANPLRKTQVKKTNFDSLKKLIFKYWDVNGPEIDRSLKNLFQTADHRIYDFDIQNMLIEYNGIDNVVNIINDFLKKEHFIKPTLTSSYKFSFFTEFDKVQNEDLFVKCYVNAEDGEVTIVDEGSMSLDKALSNPDYGWEVKSEIEGCIDDYFVSEIINKIGVRLICSKLILS
jgi:hypothetical protein